MKTKTDLLKQTIIGLAIGLFLAVGYKNAMADQCAQVFPSAAQTTSYNGEGNNNNKIIFACGTQIQGNPSNVLSTEDVRNPTGSCATKTCGSQNCTGSSSVTGMLNAGSFQTSSGSGGNPSISMTQTIGGTNNSITDYGTITLNASSVLTFSSKSSGTTTYHIQTVRMNGNATLNLPAGDYWISNFNTNGHNLIMNVLGSGTARIYFQNSFSPSGTLSWNTLGAASQLLVFGFDNFKLGGTNSVIKAIIYSRENVVLSDNLVLTGAITAEDITLNNAAKVIYDSSAVSNMDFGATCTPSSTVSQFAVNAPSTGTNCQNMTITVTAQNASAQTLTNYTGSITLNTQTGSGTWVSTSGGGAFSGNMNNGLAIYNFVTGDNGTANFQLNYPALGSTPVTIKACQTNNARIFGLSGAVNFVPASLLITDTPVSNPPASPPPAFATTETAGTSFTLYLTAYNPSNCGIVTSYNGAKNIRFYTTYLNPTMGTIKAKVNGVDIANSAAATATTQSITFTNGVATLINCRYDDAGQLTLNVIDTAVEPAGPRGVSGNFVVKPASFLLNVPNSTASQTQTAAACLTNRVFGKAGNNFTVNVQAQNSLGSVTPNYGNETSPQGIILTSGAIYGPTNARNGSANNGAVANGSTFTKITSGGGPTGTSWSLPYFQGTSFSFDEVGCINLTAAVSGANYLGAANGAVTGSLVVGRFTPDHFDVAGNRVQFKTAFSNAAGSFTYLDQPFLYATQPVLTVIARAFGGTITQNYTGTVPGTNFWKLTSGGFASVYNKAFFPVTVGDTIPNLVLSATIPPATFVDVGGGNATAAGAGTGTFTFADGGGLKIQRLSGTLMPPFTAEIQLRVAIITDTDNVACTGTGCTTGGFSFGATTLGNGIAFSGTGGGKQFYHGRLVVLNASGPETSPLTLPMQTQFYTTSGGFVLNTLDTAGSSGNGTAFTNGEANIILTQSNGLMTTATVPGLYFQGGKLDILLSAPTGTTTGYADIEANIAAIGANLPWLQYNWPYAGSAGPANTNFTANPRGRGTFGIFKGNDRVIYQKEITQ